MGADTQVLENFEYFKSGKFKRSGWYIQDKKSQLHEVYSIKKEGDNQFLHAHSQGPFVQIFKKKGWSIKNKPYLSWKWRVHTHPIKKNLKSKKEDSAASVYVVFKKSLFSVRTIKYTWTLHGKVGEKAQAKPDYPSIRIRVGKDGTGTWVSEKRNIAEDFKMFWPDAQVPNRAWAVGMVTESDSAKVKDAKADYDDFVVMSN